MEKKSSETYEKVIGQGDKMYITICTTSSAYEPSLFFQVIFIGATSKSNPDNPSSHAYEKKT